MIFLTNERSLHYLCIPCSLWCPLWESDSCVGFNGSLHVVLSSNPCKLIHNLSLRYNVFKTKKLGFIPLKIWVSFVFKFFCILHKFHLLVAGVLRVITFAIHLEIKHHFFSLKADMYTFKSWKFQVKISSELLSVFYLKTWFVFGLLLTAGVP